MASRGQLVTAGSINYIPFQDTRSENQSPLGISNGLSTHLKSNGTDSFPSTGSYHSVLSVRAWNDYSGGPFWQMAAGENNCLYYRVSSSGDTWKSYRRLWAEGDTITGAIWNDYAEYRNQVEPIEPGYCVTSLNNGKLFKTTERLQMSEGIVSDTFGFSIGETDEAKTPLAVSGRVLAYYNGELEDYSYGDVVCAGPEGKICKMTREEIVNYPDRILGHVSEIPEYETWGTGNVETKNRIWIKVR